MGPITNEFMPSESLHPQGSGAGRWFQMTQWSMVIAAGDSQSPAQLDALNQLCSMYRPAVLTFIQRTGCTREEAEDITQDFFLHLQQKKSLATVNRDKGRFRSFLLASLRNFLSNHRVKMAAQKRGGQVTIIPLERETDARPESTIASLDMPPDQEWDWMWAQTVLQRVWSALEQDYVRRGEANLFNVLGEYVTESRELPSYAQVAAQLDKTEDAIKMAVKRMRERFGEKLRAEIHATMPDAKEADQELRHLIEVLSKRPV